MNLRILRFDSVDSTNDVAISHARRGADEGLCVVALEQTKGRGRYGREWNSPRGSGLYFSAVLRPEFESAHFPLITLAAAVAVHDTLSETGVAADIKWPNDLLVGEKKISGILAETADTPNGTAVILGIGVNLLSSGLPAELSRATASIESVTGAAPDPERVLESLVKYVFFHYGRLSSTEGRAQIAAEWSNRSSFSRGKKVRAVLSGTALEGVTDGIDERGALRIRTGEGAVTVEAGDVTLLR